MKKPASNSPVPTVAYSYLRFSTAEQIKGDSLRRQVEAAKDWCERNNARLDTSTTFRDLGKSAFLGEHRKNPDRHALAAFLKLVEDGRVPRGSYFIIESLDRLTREHVRAGLMLLLGLIEAGVRIVQLSPSELVYDEKSDEMALMLAIVELSRGHRESKRKSDQIGAAWADKRDCLRRGDPQPPRRENRVNGMACLTHRLPAWIEERGGKLCLIPEPAAVVKQVFQLAIAGRGFAGIVRQLVKDGVPCFGRSGHWTRAYIAKMLKDRRAVGEFQPRRRDGRPDGGLLVGYYPAAVEETEWLAAQAGAARRKIKTGRIGKHVNLFSGLLRNAKDGGTYFAGTRTPTGRPKRGTTQRVLIPTAAAEGRTPCVSFPLVSFERAVLSLLAEVNPRELLGETSGPDESMVLAGEQARVETELADAAVFMEANGFSPTIGKRVTDLEARKRDLTARLAEVRARAANPASEAWGEAHSLLTTLDEAPDPVEARLRLRSVLRRLIAEIWLLVVPRGRDRLCAIQVWFADSAQHRDYLVFHKAGLVTGKGKKRRDPEWWAWSLADVAAPGDLDLRKRAHAKRLEVSLGQLDIAALG